ncbi:hypothetical protein ACJX0J_038834, partial [Zea mays]
NLNHNQLQGNITDVFSNLYSLSELDLSFNSLIGDLPQSFTGLSSLKRMYLQNNQFTGYINVLANLPLETLTDGNSWSTGPAPPPPPYTAPPPPNHWNGAGQNDDGSSSSGGRSGIGGGGVAGIIISLLVVGSVVAFFLIKRRKHKAIMEEQFEQHQPFTSFPSNEVNERDKSFDDDDDFSNKIAAKISNITPMKATVYSDANLQMATDSFSFDNLVGEGTFGRVYKAQFNGGKPIKESALGNIPTIAFCDTDSPMRYVDIGIPANNKGRNNIGCLFWLLARMVLQMRGTILSGHKWEVMVDLFFYRDPEEAKEQEEEAVAAPEFATVTDYQGDDQWG